jgi:hypothetical protein
VIRLRYPWTATDATALATEVASARAKVVRPGDPAHTIATGLYRALASVLPGVTRAPLEALEERAERVSVTLALPALGPVIVLSPAAVSDPVAWTCTLAHELVHVDQIERAGIAQAAVDYLGSGELRAQREADAAAAGAWLRAVLTGAPVDVAPLADLYHLAPDDHALALDIQRSHAATVAAGLVPPLNACVEIADWLRETGRVES